MVKILNKILSEKKIVFGVFDRELFLANYSDSIKKYSAVQNLDNAPSLWDVFPELIGSESKVNAIIEGKLKNYTLENICRYTTTDKLRYHTLVLVRVDSDGSEGKNLLIILSDITHETSLLQKVKQQKYEIQLLRTTLSRSNSDLSGLLIGESSKIEFIRNSIAKLADFKNTTILLEGETGTGKNLIAGMIHRNSINASAPFIEVNCASIPDTLIESEIFGYEKGAFTNATNNKKGLLEEADGGTLFLDEISELPFALQSKFLSFLESKVFRRLGSTQERTVNTRIIAATNKDLHEAVGRGEFRKDLYFRIDVLNLKLPALRDLGEDIITIANHFIHIYAYDFKKRSTHLSERARERFLRYHWPGNVRELRNVVERAVIFSEGEEIESDVIILVEEKPETRASLDEIDMKDLTLFDLEKKMIITALKKSNDNQTRAAKRLGISLDTLRYRIKKYQIK